MSAVKRLQFAYRKMSAARRSEKFDRLATFERRVYSQHGEDGILAELFAQAGTTDRFFVEFGAGEGYESNTALLARAYGWNGYLIEGDPLTFASLRKAYASYSGVVTRCASVTAESVVERFVEGNVPNEFDLLSIDIDGNDYWLWKALATRFRPRFVVIEYNAHYAPPRKWVMAYDPEHRWDGSDYYSASLESYAALGRELGYALLGTESRGANAFFCRRDVLPALRFREASVRDAYHPPNFGLRKRFRHREAKYVTM